MKNRNIYYYLWIFCFLVFSASCKSSPPNNKELAKLHEDVMLIHDDVMPKISDINRLGRRLKKLRETGNENLVGQINLLLKDLEVADEAMMSWMAEFEKPDETNIQSAKLFYENELEEISEVKILMLNSIQKAESFLQSNESNK